MLGLLLSACLLQTVMSRSPDEPIYLVTVTSQTVGGSTETLCAQLHYGTNVLKEPLNFMVPPVAVDTVAIICVTIQGEITALSKQTKILIKPGTSLTIMHTDKPIYKPGQDVKFRIVSLDSNFLIYEQVDPEFNRIAQWLNQTTTWAILDLSHPTTPEAKQGVYKITTWNERGQENFHTFEIKEYGQDTFVHDPQKVILIN
ncbi:hypothetical protein AAFF_G00168290 [Aldrovandia affinis]|uniref:Macroglobulin domain-containing protein n=1 Tax=Aldrovandia affinis TaxID=143900 RepID=A0AAD7RLZ9_9TELE|nr:hypothetical protein AAFF_G00168290 [Aldrovandia affinis]